MSYCLHVLIVIKIIFVTIFNQQITLCWLGWSKMFVRVSTRERLLRPNSDDQLPDVGKPSRAAQAAASAEACKKLCRDDLPNIVLLSVEEPPMCPPLVHTLIQFNNINLIVLTLESVGSSVFGESLTPLFLAFQG